MTFQQQWIFLNKVLHEMKIEFPSPDLVGKKGEAGGQGLLRCGAQVGRESCPHFYPLSHHRTPGSRPRMISIGP